MTNHACTPSVNARPIYVENWYRHEDCVRIEALASPLGHGCQISLSLKRPMLLAFKMKQGTRSLSKQFRMGHSGYTLHGGRRRGQKEAKKTKGSVGDGLLLRGRGPRLPSVLEGLTARFGMGLGVPPPLRSPTEPGKVWGDEGFSSHVEEGLVRLVRLG
jgi:hypothetical protein